MNDRQDTREQLVSELDRLHRRVSELEAERIKRKWAEQNLRESRSNYSAMVEAFDGLIYVTSEDHQILFMNERLIRRTGRNAVGEKCHIVMHDNDDECPWCTNNRVFQGETVHWEVLSPKDGRWYSVVNSPLRNPDSSTSKLSISRDITDLKKTEHELIVARDELEQRVEERTLDLSKANELLMYEIAERQRTEEALRKSEKKYKDLAELLPQIVFEVDTEGCITFFNCSGLEAIGYTWKEITSGIKAPDLFVPEDRKRLLRAMGRVLRAEKLEAGRYTFRRKDGSSFPVLVYGNPIVRGDEIHGIRGVAIDMTDLRRAQETLWIKDSAMASSINAIALADLDWNLTYVNPSFLRMWGCEKAKEVRGKPLLEFWQTPTEAQKVLECLPNNGWWIGEMVARRKNGSLFDAQLSVTLVSDETGKPVCLMGSFLDITERKMLQEELRISEERFRAIFEGARDCIYIKDRNLEYTRVNPAVEMLLGMPASEIVGRKAVHIFGETSGKRIEEVILRALAGQSVEEEHTRHVKGEQLTFHEITVPLRSPDGEILGTCTISRNITELRKTKPVPHIRVRDYPSLTMRSALEKASYAAAKDGIVLLMGESGSGKDYVAQWIHSHSKRASGPFFAINCAALPRDLAESELFGHEPGAFTDARGRKRGLLELAEGGTLLLNEIGELPPALQTKLLTFLDTRSFMRVGGEKSVHTNARLIAATHRNLEEEAAEERFLPALFYRLNVFSVHVPPLRERIEDMPILVEEIMSDLASEMQLGEIPVMTASALADLCQYHWPGNVRELRNVLERGLMLWDKGDFQLNLPGLETAYLGWQLGIGFPLDRTLHDVTDEVKVSLCREALRRSNGNKKEAAEILGISRYSLYRYLKSTEDKCDSHTQA